MVKGPIEYGVTFMTPGTTGFFALFARLIGTPSGSADTRKGRARRGQKPEVGDQLFIVPSYKYKGNRVEKRSQLYAPNENEKE